MEEKNKSEYIELSNALSAFSIQLERLNDHLDSLKYRGYTITHSHYTTNNCTKYYGGGAG